MTNETSPGFDAFDRRYVIGIDLGTTNSAVAYVDLAEAPDEREQRTIHGFDIPQLVTSGEIGRRPLLPSFLYLPGPYELVAGSTALPWDAARRYAVGEFAREQGARVPGRMVASAKSWLCHAGVDRTAAILPWGAKDEVPKVSAVEASKRYLLHIRESWNAQMARGEEEARFEQQLIILTVPASFDEVARELTLAAAREAGFPDAVLLEEPLAAFYAWLSVHEDDWQQRMQDGQLILICDVGGGTTDFTTVGVREGASGLRFDRLAVGEHLILGGDNMDLTLGRHLEMKLLGQPGKLDTQRWHQAVHQCRKAKEMLLGTPERAEVDVTVAGEGGRLIGDTLKDSLTREEIQRLILDGFFPAVSLDEKPGAARRTGLTELALPYVHDPKITGHLAAFWQRFAGFLQDETGRAAVYPDFVLFNGGALASGAIRRRLRNVIGAWFQPAAGDDWHPAELTNPEPALAVAVGAAYYGLVRRGQGVRVGSGSPRAYYVGVAAEDGPAGEDLRTAVCLLPRGTEEGFEVQLSQLDFQVLTNQPVAFRVFTSSTRLGDRLGDVVRLTPDEVTVLPPIRTVLLFGRKDAVRSIPVQLAVRLTAVGTLELWCQSQETEHRWRLQFDVRQAVEPDGVKNLEETVEQALVDAGQTAIRQTFQHGAAAKNHPPEALRNNLEAILEMSKERWPTAVIRKLSDALLACVDARDITSEHEARWLNLAGYCLRPGFGDPVDAWRIKQVWKLHFAGLTFSRQAQCRAEWWIFWRRIAGGLNAGQQMEIYQPVRTYLEPDRKRKPMPMYPSRIGPGEEVEIWMMLANFEWLTSNTKKELGRRLLEKFKKRRPKSQELWALSRLGARDATYGPLDRLIPREEASHWIEALLALDLEPVDSSAHALVLIARCTGDRTRDVSEALRSRVAGWLAPLHNTERFQDLLTNPQSTLRAEEQDWIFGESLPAGLRLRRSQTDDRSRHAPSNGGSQAQGAGPG